MGDSLSVIFATIVAAIIMFLFPMLDTWERQDDLSYIAAYTSVVNTVDSVRNTGRLTADMYNNLITSLNATGNRFDIQLKHKATEYVNAGADKYEVVYLNHYTNDLVAALESPSGEYTDFRKGDYFYISVKNRNKTQATVLKQNLYNTRLETFKIGVPYGGQIRNEYVR